MGFFLSPADSLLQTRVAMLEQEKTGSDPDWRKSYILGDK